MSLGTTTAPGEFLAPFVPSPEALVDRMLEIARVGPGDTVYDLGAGDGRIVVAAAQRFGARAVGVELDDQRFALASARIRDLGLGARAQMMHGDLLGINLNPATVVTLYQLPTVNELLRPALERQLRSGSRVVTLDFPVPGWEAASVLTGRLADNSQHAIYLYAISQIRKESTTMGSKASYVAGRYALELQGVSAGFVKSVEGGDATADVVTEKLGADNILHKHIGGLKYEEIAISLGAGMSANAYDWIDAAMRRVAKRINGAVVGLDLDYREVSRLNFYDGLISEICFPALDDGNKEPAYITVKIAPDYTRRQPGSGQKHFSPASQKTPWLRTNFRLQIDDLDCTHVNKIDALTITQQINGSAIGEQRIYQNEPGYLEVSNLALTLSESGSDTFRQWHEDFVIKGNNSDSAEKNGTLEYLSSNLKDVLFTLTFRHLGIFKLTPEKVEAGSETVRRLRAEMYCEDIGFQYWPLVGAAKSAAAGTSAAATPTSAPAYSGTQVVSPVYVRQYAADKIQAVVSPELVAVPTRLGRPLRFRS